MKYLLILLASLTLAACAGLTPPGQKINTVVKVGKAVVAKQLDTALDTNREFSCNDITYGAEVRAKTRWNVTNETWADYCGRTNPHR